MSDINTGKKAGNLFLGFIMGAYDKIKNSKYDYKILNQIKKVTIYKNGHGIIENKFKIQVINPENFKKFCRNINISDAKKETVFPKFDDMQSTKKDRRLTKFGFWYTCKNEIIKKVELCNDKDDNEFLANINKTPGKNLPFKFIIDNNKIKKNEIYEFTYSISIPGMYNITGFYPLDDSDMKTRLKINHNTENVEYSIGFDKSFTLEEAPSCKLCHFLQNNKHKEKNVEGEYILHDFYHKYKFIISKPKFNDMIKIQWKIKKESD